MMAAPPDESVQNVSVTFGPRVPEPGTIRLVSRQLDISEIGSAQRRVRFGERGPLNSQGWRSPQRPPKVAQPNSLFGSGSFGTTTTASGVSVPVGRELSQPKPVPFSPQPR